MKPVYLILFFLAVTGFYGCTETKESKDTSPNYDELIIGTGRDSTRPGNYQTFGMWEPSCLIYETLVNLDRDSKPIPNLAKSWTVSPDGKKYTFELEKSVKFHDGTSFNAEAVKINYEKLGALSWQMLNRVIQSVEVKNSYTIEFVLSRPSRLFLHHLAISTHGIVAPSVITPGSMNRKTPDNQKAAVTMSMQKGMKKEKGMPEVLKKRRMPAGMMGQKSDLQKMSRNTSWKRDRAKSRYLVKKAIGTGPYYWNEAAYQRGREFSVLRNDQYWVKPPVFKKITWLVIPDPASRTIALESGEIQMTGQSPNASLTEENLITLRQNSKIRLTKGSNWGARLVIVNHKRPPFDNPEVRRAIKHAIDYSAIQKVIGELATICPGPFGPLSPFILPNTKLPVYDPVKAKKILENAGLKDIDGDGVREFKGKPVQIEIVVGKSQATGVLLSEYLKKVGIHTTLKPKESGSIFSVLQEMDYDIITHPNIPSFYLDLYGSFHSKSWLSLHLDNPKIDALLKRYLRSADEKEFMELNYKIQQEILDLNVILFAVNESKMAAYHKNLGQFEYPPEEWVGALQNVWKQR